MKNPESSLPQPVNPAEWPRPRGYANAMVARGKVVALAGQIGWDPVTSKFTASDFLSQLRQTLVNVRAALRAASAGPEHLVRLTWFITDREAYVSQLAEVGRAYREVIGAHYPAMSVVIVSALVEAQAMVEIEATAVLPE